MASDLEIYLDNTRKPWGTLFYRTVWEQLKFAKGLTVLDFGSGFGHTAGHLAEENAVTAVEPLGEMTEMIPQTTPFRQIVGDSSALREMREASFDLITCHNVLEYAADRAKIMGEFSRLLKKGGLLSVVKHNHVGRVMQKVVFENALDEAQSLLDGGTVDVRNFGQVRYYGPEELEQWGSGLKIADIQGVRIFFGLYHNNAVKEQQEWQDKIFRLEMAVCGQEPYKSIAMFQHIFMRKE